MSNCSNCYNGCTEIVSDQCVRYTGLDVPVLGIQNGDSLSYVEQALITFLTSTLDGTGIVITLPEGTYCELVTSYLPTCGDITAVNLFEALVKSACDLQTQVDVVVADLVVLNEDYTVGCLTGVTASSGTHDILQAVITKLCQIDVSLTALALDVSTNYVKLADLDALIAAYLSGIAPVVTQQSVKMIPYTVVEYYGNLSYFDGTGAGISSMGFENIYLCNGLNGTPDKRGRVPVGAIVGVVGGALAPAVDPSNPGNPNYALSAVAGANSVILTTNQIPSHIHVNTATTTVTSAPHTHTLVGGYGTGEGGATINTQVAIARENAFDGNSTYNLTNASVNSVLYGKSGETTTTATAATTMVNAEAGGGLSHNNIQPVLACYYIMYIP